MSRCAREACSREASAELALLQQCTIQLTSWLCAVGSVVREDVVRDKLRSDFRAQSLFLCRLCSHAGM